MNASKDSVNLPPIQDEHLEKTSRTHRSALNEKNTQGASYERLEFLGDAVLELISSEFLYNTLPNKPEGTLTALRSALVKTETLAHLAGSFNMGERLIMSRGEEKSGGRKNVSILADCFEAYLGALYLDQGLQKVQEFLRAHVFPLLATIQKNHLYKDFKGSLQEYLQAKMMDPPTYVVIKQEGPDHHKVFTVAVCIQKKHIAVATGRSKHTASQQAAKKALELVTKKLDSGL